jgi:hypothetical protein
MTFLESLSQKHGSDKYGHHDYCRHYERHFKELQFKPVILLELGIGGYEYPDRGGAGLRMWSDFFLDGKIYGLDLFDKSGIKLPARTKIFQGSQADGDFLTKVMLEVGEPHIIIDDASHMNGLTIQSFKHLFPWLKSGGYYVIEDIESSWWDKHGYDGTPNENDPIFPSTINFCRALINCVNRKHVPIQPDDDNMGDYPYPFRNLYQEIESMHFYQNMVVIKKK